MIRIKLKIKFIPYEKTGEDSFKGLLKDLQKDTIILIDAKLKPEQEAELIKKTMEKVSEKFTGIELSSIDISPEKDSTLFEKLRGFVFQLTTGKRRGMTVIGPAHIITKIEKNPEELMLYV